MGSLIRRIALSATVKACRNEAPTFTGKHQFACGTPNGYTLIHQAVTTELLRDKDKCIIALDIASAFQAPHRDIMLNEIEKASIPLSRIFANWYCCARFHVIRSPGDTYSVVPARGVDQGCPASPLFFSISIKETLDTVARRLKECDVNSHLYAYADDMQVVIDQHKVKECVDIADQELTKLGLQLNRDKTSVFSYNFDHPLYENDEVLKGWKTNNLLCLGTRITNFGDDFHASLDNENEDLISPGPMLNSSR